MRLSNVSRLFMSVHEGMSDKRYSRHSIHGVSSGERRVGEVGPMIIQAAKQGSKDNLEFLLNLPEGRCINARPPTGSYSKSLTELRNRIAYRISRAIKYPA